MQRAGRCSDPNKGSETMNIRSIESDYPGNIEVFWEDDRELALRDYDPMVINGVESLAHGETPFTFESGGTVTRIHDKTLWTAPPRVREVT
jgi:hypothetical protein